MRVMVAMSGGVDSSVAAALLCEEGHEVVGVTLKLWGGEVGSGCCSVSDVEDARRVAQQLGIDHHVFDLTEVFAESVVDPYVRAHQRGITPNPCVECNRHVKFQSLLQRSEALGFDLLATGHHATVAVRPGGSRRLARGADRSKDQSYVLHMLDAEQLARVVFPVGRLSKPQVREHAARLGLRSATKPDSQEVCFIDTSSGRAGFLGERIELHPAELVDRCGGGVGRVAAVELITVGQRRGLGAAGGTERRYAVEVDVEGRRVVLGSRSELLCDGVVLEGLRWAGDPVQAPARVMAQCSAHGEAADAVVEGSTLRWSAPRRRVAPGQSVVLYLGDEVVGAAVAGGAAGSGT